MSKGSKRRPEARSGAFAEGHAAIDWSKGRPVKVMGHIEQSAPIELPPDAPIVRQILERQDYHALEAIRKAARLSVGLTKEQEAELREYGLWDVTVGDGLEDAP